MDGTPETPAAGRGLLVGAIVFVAALAFFWPFALSTLTWAQDEGVELVAASQILEGRTLYTEIVQSLKLPVHLLAGLLAIFGRKVIVARIAEAAVCALLAVVVYRFTARRAGALFGLLAAGCTAAWSLPFWNIVGWDWEGVILAFTTAGLFKRGLDGMGVRWFLAAGAACAALFFFQPDNGVELGMALAAYLAIRSTTGRRSAGNGGAALLRRLGAFAGGGTAVAACVVAWALAAGFLGEMIRQTITGPLTTFDYLGRLGIPYPLPPYERPPEPWWYGDSYRVWAIYLLPVVTIPAAIAMVARRLARRDPLAWDDLFVLVVCVAVFLPAFPRSDIFHLIFGLPGVFVLAAWLLSRAHACVCARAGAGPASGRVAAVAFATPLLLIAWNGWSHAVELRGGDLVPSSFPALTGVRIEREREEEFRGIAGFLDARGARRGAEVLVLPADPIIYFVLGLDNPTRFNRIDYGQHDDGDEREVIAQLDRKGVRWVIFNGWHQDHRFRREAPLIHAHLAAHYRPAARIGPYTVLERAGDP